MLNMDVCLALLATLLFSSPVSAFESLLSLESGGTVNETLQLGDLVDISLDSLEPANGVTGVYGNM